MAEDETDPFREALENAEDIEPLPRDATDPGDPPPPRTPDGPSEPPSHGDDDPIAECALLPLNDYGNGRRLAIHFGSDIIYVPMVGWFTWIGTHWRPDTATSDIAGMAVRAKAQCLADLIAKEVDYIQPNKRERGLIVEMRGINERISEIEAKALELRTDEEDEELARLAGRAKTIEASLKGYNTAIAARLRHAKNAGNSGPLRNMMTESTIALTKDFDALDTHPLDINTPTGLLRFIRIDAREDGGGVTATVECLAHQREQLITKITGAKYDPDATCPAFDKFFEEIQPDRERREYIMRWLGLSMSGVKHQGFAFFYGTGANGKSVLVDLISRILGSYAASIRIESLTGTNTRNGADATPDLIPAMGARMVRTSEPDEGKRLAEGLIKQLTGGEPILVRPNYGEFIEVDPDFKVTMSGNHKPDIRGDDEGIWRRVMLVPFEIRIPPERRDPDLGEKLWAEAPGILNRIIDGLCDYLEGGLRPPESVLSATQEFREDSDPIGAFLTKCCAITGQDEDRINSDALAHAFNFYLMENAMTTWTPTTISRRIADKERTWRHPETGLRFQKRKSSRSGYAGIRLTAAFQARFDAAPKDASGRPINTGSATPDPVDDPTWEDREDM